MSISRHNQRDKKGTPLGFSAYSLPSADPVFPLPPYTLTLSRSLSIFFLTHSPFYFSLYPSLFLSLPLSLFRILSLFLSVLLSLLPFFETSLFLRRSSLLSHFSIRCYYMTSSFLLFLWSLALYVVFNLNIFPYYHLPLSMIFLTVSFFLSARYSYACVALCVRVCVIPSAGG